MVEIEMGKWDARSLNDPTMHSIEWSRFKSSLGKTFKIPGVK